LICPISMEDTECAAFEEEDVKFNLITANLGCCTESVSCVLEGAVECSPVTTDNWLVVVETKICEWRPVIYNVSNFLLVEVSRVKKFKNK